MEKLLKEAMKEIKARAEYHEHRGEFEEALKIWGISYLMEAVLEGDKEAMKELCWATR